MAVQIDVKEFLDKAGLDEPLYPGKRVIKKMPQSGENKSHCIVYDWRDPKKIVVAVKAGLTGNDLPAKELVKYPPSLQSPTYVEINVTE